MAGAQPIPPGYSATDQIREVVTHLYYISPNSSVGVGVPALNRIELREGPALINQELIPGVEDLQVQLGVDSDDDGSVNSYLTPNDPAVAGASIVATRAWLLVRGERIDLGFTDTATYDYADLSVEPADQFRRMLMTKTLRLRNSSS